MDERKKPKPLARKGSVWTVTIRRNFQVEVTPARFSNREERFDLSTRTYENSWWTTGDLSRDELKKIRDTIDEFLAEEPS
ncbi:MAG TPA: hypothetical protein VKU80_17615 [Planctomycetota bacterium]|nr:hypothetical protein [Planctomycetota bacterium]